MKHLNEAIEIATEVGATPPARFEEILKDEEHHVDYLEGHCTQSTKWVSRISCRSSLQGGRRKTGDRKAGWQISRFCIIAEITWCASCSRAGATPCT